LKISAKNRLKGVVKSVEKGDVITKVKVKITAPATITALISTEAAEDLGIKVNDEVEAVIKATDHDNETESSDSRILLVRDHLMLRGFIIILLAPLNRARKRDPPISL
jgi:molybdopterin-binding protein